MRLTKYIIISVSSPTDLEPLGTDRAALSGMILTKLTKERRRSCVSLEGNTRKMSKTGEENASAVKDPGCSDYSVEK